MIYKPISILLICCALASAQNSRLSFEQVAAAATAMLDGDVCRRIQTPRSLKYAAIKDPRDPWRAADNYDVNADAFNQTKKTLIRLSHLCPETCDVNLWMPFASRPGRVAIVIRNVHEMSQFWHWGDLDQPIPAEMAQVLESAKPVRVKQKPGMISVLAPVFDSLGEVAAIAEVVSEHNQNPRENVK